MIIEHYTQTVDLGYNGRIDGTLDYSIQEVNFHFVAWKDGKKTHERKIRYNIMYDYERSQHWWNGQLIEDVLEAGYYYGHLMEEECNEITWKDNFEPVSPYGCEAYQTNDGWRGFVKLPENRIGIEFSYSPYGEDGILKTGKIFDTEELSDYGIIQALEWLEEDKRKFDPIKAREERLRFYTDRKGNLIERVMRRLTLRHMVNQTYSEWLRTEVPIDMSMVD